MKCILFGIIDEVFVRALQKSLDRRQHLFGPSAVVLTLLFSNVHHWMHLGELERHKSLANAHPLLRIGTLNVERDHVAEELGIQFDPYFRY